MALPVQRLLGDRPLAADLSALIAGGIYPLAFSPFGLWPLGILALAILLAVTTARGVSRWRGSVRYYLFSVGMYGVGTSWIYVSIHEFGGASPPLAAFLVMLFVLGISLLSWLHGYLYLRFIRPLALGIVVGFPLAWFLREWIFTWLLTGFPWLYAGYAHLDSWLAGYLPVLSVLGTGFLVALHASLLVFWLQAPDVRRGTAALLILAVIWVGGFVLERVSFVRPVGEPLVVAAVQGNIAQSTKWHPDRVGPIIDTYLGLTNAAWTSDLIVWPEAAITLFREDAAPLLDVLDRRASEADATIILGIPDSSPEGAFWNSAIALGKGEGRYVKRRLVPFGEYVPLESLLRGTIELFDLPMSRNRPGPWRQPPLTADGLNVAMSICYEIVYPELVRAATVRPDLLITISNDTWFGDSIGPWQHMEMARARALENGRYLVRATNNGITAIVAPDGEVTARLPRFEQGVLRGEIYRVEGSTPWSRVGLLPQLLLAAAALLGMSLYGWHVSRRTIR